MQQEPERKSVLQKERLKKQLNEALEALAADKEEKMMEALSVVPFFLGPPGEICEVCGGSGRKKKAQAN